MTVSTSSTAPLVVIVGVTGKQGGSVARALIESDKPYRIRGLTRDASRPAAKAFASEGIEIVAVSISVGNEAAVRAAFEGAAVIFAVTNFNEHGSAEREIAEGKLMVDAAKAVNTSLLIWSALESFKELSSGRVPNSVFFDTKAAVTAYAKVSGVPLSIVQAAYYATNIFDAVPYALRAQDDGSYTFSFPMSASTKVPLIDPETDYGLYVRAAIELPQFGAGSELLSGTSISMEEIFVDLSEVTGKKIVYTPYTKEEFADVFPMKPLLPVISDMFEAYETIGYYGKKPLTAHDVLARKPHTWRQYLESIPKEELLGKLGLAAAQA
ncbi:NAD(P)-binding protein [Mycena amicta]|nr:NAD(P)-binding protein [Mycena amicta]